jgi:hypothetical protein
VQLQTIKSRQASGIWSKFISIAAPNNHHPTFTPFQLDMIIRAYKCLPVSISRLGSVLALYACIRHHSSGAYSRGFLISQIIHSLPCLRILVIQLTDKLFTLFDFLIS